MSEVFKLNGIDWGKLFRGLLVAIGGAVLTYVESAIPGIDFGTSTPMVVAGNSFLVNLLRKLLTKT